MKERRMNFHILTLFPDMVMQGLSTSIIGRAKDRGLLSIEALNIRSFAIGCVNVGPCGVK